MGLIEKSMWFTTATIWLTSCPACHGYFSVLRSHKLMTCVFAIVSLTAAESLTFSAEQNSGPQHGKLLSGAAGAAAAAPTMYGTAF